MAWSHLQKIKLSRRLFLTLGGIIYSSAVCRIPSEQAGNTAGAVSAGGNQLCSSKAGNTGKARQDSSG